MHGSDAKLLLSSVLAVKYLFFPPPLPAQVNCVCVYVWPHGVPLCVQCRIPYVCLCERMRVRTFPGSSTSGCRSEFLSSF